MNTSKHKKERFTEDEVKSIASVIKMNREKSPAEISSILRKMFPGRSENSLYQKVLYEVKRMSFKQQPKETIVSKEIVPSSDIRGIFLNKEDMMHLPIDRLQDLAVGRVRRMSKEQIVNMLIAFGR